MKFTACTTEWVTHRENLTHTHTKNKDDVHVLIHTLNLRSTYHRSDPIISLVNARIHMPWSLPSKGLYSSVTGEMGSVCKKVCDAALASVKCQVRV